MAENITADRAATQEEMSEQFAKVQKQYYDSLLIEMKDDCETYKKATEWVKFILTKQIYIKYHKFLDLR